MKNQRKMNKFKVDPACQIGSVHVFEDYSCKLVLKDIEFSAVTQDKFLRMQLLQRKGAEKWFLWYGVQRAGRENITTRIYNFLNYQDAEREFQAKFKKETGNDWKNRDYFKPKLSKYVLVNAEREKEQLRNAQQMEKDLFKILEKTGLIKRSRDKAVEAEEMQEMKLETELDAKGVDERIFELLAFVWDLNAYK